MDLTTGFGNSLARLILMVATDLDRAGSIYLAPAAMVALEQFVFTSLLMSHPHNYSAALRRGEKPIAPRDVKRAIDYMQGHLDVPIRLADIVRASGVPGRTLFKHFSDCRGISPMRYLRNARLDKVRETLRRVAPEARITDIAMGFHPYGTFFCRIPSAIWRKSLCNAVRRCLFAIVFAEPCVAVVFRFSYGMVEGTALQLSLVLFGAEGGARLSGALKCSTFTALVFCGIAGRMG